MKYDKPEITAMGHAITAVQTNEKSPEENSDNFDQVTIAAYEADE